MRRMTSTNKNSKFSSFNFFLNSIFKPFFPLFFPTLAKIGLMSMRLLIWSWNCISFKMWSWNYQLWMQNTRQVTIYHWEQPDIFVFQLVQYLKVSNYPASKTYNQYHTSINYQLSFKECKEELTGSEVNIILTTII